MDTITQVALGAAVGEVTLGKKVGNKAILWGGVAGTIPDLDILSGPFMDSVSRIAFHRGFSHSILFALLFAPVLGYLIYRIYKGREANWWDWSKLAFWSLFTHSILDNFTSYGTQFFWPFSDYRVALNTIFVIDPLYTVPLVISVIAVLFYHRSSQKRQVLNFLGLGVSILYLMFTVVNKLYVNSVFENQLREKNISYQRILSAPTPLNNILWRTVAESPDGYYEGYYSLFDQGKEIELDYFEKNHKLLSGLKHRPKIQKLDWITKGFYTVSKENGDLFLNDMRYGRMNGWAKFEGEFIFSFRIDLTPPKPSNKLYVERERGEFKYDSSAIENFARRVLGE